MKRKDLQGGMVVELRNGRKCLLAKTVIDGSTISDGFFNLTDMENGECIIRMNTIGYNAYRSINEKCPDTRLAFAEEIEIMKVYRDYTLQEVIWERKELPQLSPEAIAVLKILPKKWKYIAADSYTQNSWLWVFTEEPIYTDSEYWDKKDQSDCEAQDLEIFKELFKEFPKGKCYLIEDLIKGGE